MIWHLTYQIDKDAHRKQWWDEYYRAEFHPKVPHWERVFDIDDLGVIKDLNLEGMNVSPRYSYQWADTLLPEHIDEDEIIGINLNLNEEEISINMEGTEYVYSAAVVDVGHHRHSVTPVRYDRLILKLAIREPLEDVLERVKHLLVTE